MIPFSLVMNMKTNYWPYVATVFLVGVPAQKNIYINKHIFFYSKTDLEFYPLLWYLVAHSKMAMLMANF